MLMLTLREGDYFVVGEDVKISYERCEGKDKVYIGIDAPKSVSVLRGKLYEEQIALKAAAGNTEAQITNEQLLEEYEERKQKYNRRRASRAEQERRAALGEIKPAATAKTDLPIKNRIHRNEKNRQALDPARKIPSNYKDWENEQRQWVKEQGLWD